MREWLKRFLIIPPIAIAVAIFIWMTSQEAPELTPPPEASVAVRSQTIEPVSYAITASGFGRAEAVRSWSAVAQVEGRLVSLSDDVTVGTVVSAGDLLFEIDPRDYEIALAQAEAARASAQADLQELEVNAVNTESSLEVEREILEVLGSELERLETLVSRGGVAQSDLDSTTRSYLSQQKVVVDLEAQLDLFGPQRIAAEASLASAEADIESAQRDLDATTIVAPFAGRVVSSDVVEDEYIRVGDTLLSLDDIVASEVEGAFQIGQIGNLIDSVPSSITLAALSRSGSMDAFSAVSNVGLSAAVRLSSGGDIFEWPATLVRSNGSIDSQTGAIGLVVEVKDPTRVDPATRRPPLTNGVFVEVVLTAPEVRDAILIPRSALRQSAQGAPEFVYVIDANSRLARKDVVSGSIVGNDVAITSGLEIGDRVVLSDPKPAILGLLLEPVDVTE